MSIKKQIPNNEWQERLQLLISGNRGRKATIAVQGTTIVENHELRDVEYDPVGKGNDLIITQGYSDQLYTHTVDAPVDISIIEEADGIVFTVEIVDKFGSLTFLRLMRY